MLVKITCRSIRVIMSALRFRFVVVKLCNGRLPMLECIHNIIPMYWIEGLIGQVGNMGVRTNGQVRHLPGPGTRHLLYLRYKKANLDYNLGMKTVKKDLPGQEYGFPTPENCSADAHCIFGKWNERFVATIYFISSMKWVKCRKIFDKKVHQTFFPIPYINKFLQTLYFYLWLCFANL